MRSQRAEVFCADDSSSSSSSSSSMSVVALRLLAISTAVAVIIAPPSASAFTGSGTSAARRRTNQSAEKKTPTFRSVTSSRKTLNWAWTAPSTTSPGTTTVLFAKKKKNNNAAIAALEALEALEANEVFDDAPLSKKEQKELQKKQKKEQKAAAAAAAAAKAAAEEAAKLATHAAALENAKNGAAVNGDNSNKPAPDDAKPAKKMSKKEQMLMKALEMEKLDEERNAAANAADDTPKLSKKELKALKKKEEKAAAKAAAKAAKKAAKKAEKEGLDPTDAAAAAATGGDKVNGDVNGADTSAVPGGVNGEATAAAAPPPAPAKLTLEEKMRKDRPPPRVRVMENSQPDFIALRLEDVGITFRDQAVLKDVTWGVQTGDRIGLVGANGAGKTTQLRIMAGELEPTVGDVVKSNKDLRVAVLRQEFVDELVPERSLKEEFSSIFAEENKILADLKNLEQELSEIPPEDADRMQSILDQMQDLQNKAENKGAYKLESRVQKVMDLMGFNKDEANDPVRSFSGGWKMRIGLGKVLLQDPNVLLLDEPTNHLDLESVEWLEAFLREQNLPMVIVSHDREFLDQVCTKIVDAEGGACTEYNGCNYSKFLKNKKTRIDAWQASYDAQEKKLKEERQWINKFKVKQAQVAKQRQAKMEKFIKSDEYVKKPPFVGKPFKFRFPQAPRLSPEVGEVKSMTHAYSNEVSTNKLFDEVDLAVEKGDRIAILGPNGSGKSTLMRLLIGREKPDSGSAELVGQNVVMNYFEQNQADALDLSKTVLETIQGASTGQSYNELRALLGQFLFKGDAVDKKVINLSGGEKARLSLCCMMLQSANLLILDEPTNHLDIPAKEMLEEALQHFDGSVMVISHDRYFISKVATSIVAIEDKKLVKYGGDYKFYMDKSQKVKEKVEARYVKGVDRIGSAPIIDLEELLAKNTKKNFGGAKTANLVTRKNKGVKNAKRNKIK